MRNFNSNIKSRHSASMNMRNVIIAKFGNLANKAFLKNKTIILPKEYLFVGKVDAKTFRSNGFVHVYRRKGETLIVKAHKFLVKDMDQLYLRNEIRSLAFLNSFQPKSSNKKGVKVKVPTLVDFSVGKNTLFLSTSVERGVSLKEFDNQTKVRVLKSILGFLVERNINPQKNSNWNLSKRGLHSYVLNFPLLALKVVIQDHQNALFILKASVLFTLLLPKIMRTKRSMTLSHRDLSPENILYNKKTKQVTVLDWENTVITDRMYEVASLPFLYPELYREGELQKLPGTLDVAASRDELAFFALIYGMQRLSSSKVRSVGYKNAMNTLRRIYDFYKEGDRKKTTSKTVYEFVNEKVLKFIYLLTKVLPYLQIDKNVNFVMCYHSIGTTNWRFSTPVLEFERQIAYLSERSRLITLDQLLSGKEGVVISFDDGYEDIYKNALPILKKYHTTATLFTISNPERANRRKLQNQLKFMTDKQLKELKNEGWVIGFHTRTHPNLGELGVESLKDEIVLGKKALERKVNCKVKYFAYPLGIYNSQVLEAVAEAGFKAAFTINGGGFQHDNPLLFSRIALEGTYKMEQFIASLSKPGIFYGTFSMWALQMKEYAKLWKVQVLRRFSLRNALKSSKFGFSMGN